MNSRHLFEDRRARPTDLRAGFTVLLAALIASLVLSLGISIFSIAYKSITLSTLGRDSQYAFYAADSAAECALYWDVRFDAFATSSPAASIRCDDPDPPNPITVTNNLPTWPDTVFTIGGATPFEIGGNCAIVTVTKSDTAPFTTIKADGYNVSCAERDTNPRTLQRSVELNY
jgi:hypothetical protein